MKQIKTPEFLKPLASAFAQAGHHVYLVGGVVRNALMGLAVSDFDIAGDAGAEEAVRLARSAGYTASVRTTALGTVDIICADGRAEYTPFRTEIYTPGGAHRPISVSFDADMAADAARRDFTCNALYADVLTGTVVDPLGGLADLQGGVLRACGQTAAQTLKDDGVRILRMARFAGELGFLPNEDLMAAARENARNMLALTPTRLYGEWKKICQAQEKYPSLRPELDKPLHALMILHQCGALKEMMPPLYDGIGVVQKKEYHAHDVFTHNLMTFAAMPGDVVLKTAGLCHDWGKPQCAKENGGRMLGHEKVSVMLAGPVLNALGFSLSEQQAVLTLIARHMYDLRGEAREKTLRVRFAVWGFAFVEQLIQMRRADLIGSGRRLTGDNGLQRWIDLLDAMRSEGAIDDPADLAISGREIMALCQIGPSARVGEIKQALFERCAVDPSLNTAARLSALAPKIHRELGPS